MRARVVVDPDFCVGEIDRRLYGAFVEHMGRCVYGGVFEPDHPFADESGLRRDVIELTRELGVSVVRYPGGNFVSGYRWEDGVGPVAGRPTRLDLAWKSVETNAFGLHEFVDWTRRAQVEPMLAVNLGTRGVQEAADLVEYANHPSGTELSERRRRNGSPDPFGVKLWCLGNEMDGPWQVGQKSAEEYGALAAEAGKAMKLVDPTIQLVACGSSGRGMSTFGAWERTVLSRAYDVVDYISLHAYYEPHAGDLASFLASPADMDAFIGDVVATCDHVKAVRRSDKPMMLSFDEWNVWHQTDYHDQPERDWEHAPRLIEDTYSVADAVVVGGFLIALLSHADRVTVACQAQLVNIIAPIRTEPGGPAWRQTIFHPFALASRYGTGRSLHLSVDAPLLDTDRYGRVPALQAAAAFDDGQLSLFLVNRSIDEPIDLSVALRGMGEDISIAEHRFIADADVHAGNSADHPDRVVPRRGTARLDGNTLQATVPPVSFSVIVLTTRGGHH
jgi:alpha-N-arabinofuranosidase